MAPPRAFVVSRAELDRFGIGHDPDRLIDRSHSERLLLEMVQWAYRSDFGPEVVAFRAVHAVSERPAFGGPDREYWRFEPLEQHEADAETAGSGRRLGSVELVSRPRPAT